MPQHVERLRLEVEHMRKMLLADINQVLTWKTHETESITLRSSLRPYLKRLQVTSVTQHLDEFKCVIISIYVLICCPKYKKNIVTIS